MNLPAGPVHRVKLLADPQPEIPGGLAWSETHTECGENLGFLKSSDWTYLHQRTTCVKCLKEIKKVKPKPRRLGRIG